MLHGFGAVVIVAYFTGIKNVFPAKFKEKTAIMDGIKLEMDSLPNESASCVAIRSEEIGLTELHEVSSGLNIISGLCLMQCIRALMWKSGLKQETSYFVQ